MRAKSHKSHEQKIFWKIVEGRQNKRVMHLKAALRFTNFLSYKLFSRHFLQLFSAQSEKKEVAIVVTKVGEKTGSTVTQLLLFITPLGQIL